MSDHEAPPLPADMTELLQNARVIAPMPEASRERLSKRLDLGLLAPHESSREPPSPETSDDSTVQAPLDPTVGSATSRAWVARLATNIGIGALGITIGVAGTLLVQNTRNDVARSHTTRVGASAAHDPSIAPLSRAPFERKRRNETPDETAPQMAEAPSAQRENDGGRTGSLADERRLLDDARSALMRGDVAAAIGPLAMHEKAFRSGMLVEERDALFVQTLARSGRAGEAKARATMFRRTFPNSLFRSTVDELSPE